MKKAILFFITLLPVSGWSQGTEELPPEFQNVDVMEKLGSPIPLDVRFASGSGDTVTLGSLLGNGKPVILNPVYYECPLLCTLVLNGLVDGLKQSDLVLGRDYDVITFSINPEEDAPMAARKKRAYLAELGAGVDSSAWHFLTGSKASIDALTGAVGFGYRWDEETKQYAHAASIMFLSPNGVVTRYLYGLEYKSFDLNKALSEAADGTIGSTIDRIVMYCFTYDPTLRSYVPHAINIMKVGGVLTMVLLGGFLAIMWSKERFLNKQPLNIEPRA
jgi:protein SCO1/2